MVKIIDFYFVGKICYLLVVSFIESISVMVVSYFGFGIFFRVMLGFNGDCCMFRKLCFF